MNNLTETQKEAISSLVNLTEEFCNRELSQKAERLKGLFPEAFAEPKDNIVITVESNVIPDVTIKRESVGIYSVTVDEPKKIIYTGTNFIIDGKKVNPEEDKPELYTAEDMIGFAGYWRDDIGNHDSIYESFEDWKK